MIWVTIVGAFLNALLAIWGFRTNTHHIEPGSANKHLSGFGVLVLAAFLLSVSGVLLTAKSSKTEKDSLLAQIARLEQTIRDAQAPALSIEHVGTIAAPAGGQTLMMQIRNTGRTPALHTHAVLTLNRGHNPKEADLHYDEREAINDVTVPPDGVMMDALTTLITKRDLKNWAAAQDGIKTYLVGSLWFSNDAGRKTEIPFCYVLTNEMFWQGATPKTCF